MAYISDNVGKLGASRRQHHLAEMDDNLRDDSDDTLIRPKVDLRDGPRNGKQRSTWRGACLIDLVGPTIGERFEISGHRMQIGRARSCDIHLPRGAVSREHATILVEDGQVRIRDERSTNGTYVNDEPIDEVELRDGDRVWIGHTTLKFLCGDNLENRYHLWIRRLAYEDGLTGVGNRRSFDDRVRSEFDAAQESGMPMSVIMIDVDRFKFCNDHHGHHTGDRVLTRMASLLSANVGPRDLVARYGGEEFAIVAPDLDLAAASHLGEQLRSVVERERFSGDNGDFHVTVSVGVSSLRADTPTAHELVELADRRLYMAKELGRNRVVSHGG